MNETNIDTLLDQAYALLDTGQFPQALQLFTQICNADNSIAEAWLMRGAIQGEMGNVDDAIELIQIAINTDPQYADPYVTLAQIYTIQNRYTEAAELCEKAVSIDPDYTEAWIKLSGLYGSLDQLEDAERCSRKAVNQSPNNAEANVNLANALFGQRKVEQAAEIFKRALVISPNLPELHTSLGNCHLWLNRYEQALQSFECVLESNSGDHNACYQIATVYQRMGNFDKAIEYLEKTLAIKPDFSRAIVSKADLLEQRGDLEQANNIIQQLIRSGDDSIALAITYARIARHNNNYDEAIKLLINAANVHNATNDENISINMALAGIYDRIQKFDDAFTCYKKANSLQRFNYDHAKQVKYIDSIIEMYSSDNIAKLNSSTIKTDMPIFIVGMPRSGTSLVEQILASHPGLYAGGELMDIPDITASLNKYTASGTPYPECVEQITQMTLDEIASSYLARRQTEQPDILRFTDKLPHNFQHIGLIKQLFPDAYIIYCIRNALDNCLSCYFTDFSGQHPYSYDLVNIGKHYNEHLRMMAHWKDSLGMNILTVKYEDIVENQEAVSREIIDFSGLEWDEKCLRFYETQRHTLTASYDQVRKPIYTRSVQRWKNYASYIQPLRDTLVDSSEM